MPKPDDTGKPQAPAAAPTAAADGSRDDGDAAPRRAWFPPAADDFEITPEAAMYAGRR